MMFGKTGDRRERGEARILGKGVLQPILDAAEVLGRQAAFPGLKRARAGKIGVRAQQLDGQVLSERINPKTRQGRVCSHFRQYRAADLLDDIVLVALGRYQLESACPRDQIFRVG